MRLRLLVNLGHSQFPSREELALHDKVFPRLNKVAFVRSVGLGTKHGAIYWTVEIVDEHSDEALAGIHQLLQRFEIDDNTVVSPEALPVVRQARDAKDDVSRRAQRRLAAERLNTPPDYLEGKVVEPRKDGPARSLHDGQWCGHGMINYQVFDVQHLGRREFSVRLPSSDDERLNPPIVSVKAGSEIDFNVYDSRKHTASIYNDAEYRDMKTRMKRPCRCPTCGKQIFELAVGFELPEDPSERNDTSWFVLAGSCIGCGWTDLIYEDETA